MAVKTLTSQPKSRFRCRFRDKKKLHAEMNQFFLSNGATHRNFSRYFTSEVIFMAYKFWVRHQKNAKPKPPQAYKELGRHDIDGVTRNQNVVPGSVTYSI